MSKAAKTKFRNTLILIINILILSGVVIVFFGYIRDYSEKIRKQNIDDISNINQASANIASTFFLSRETKLKDLALYIEKNGLTLQQSLEYISETNSDKSMQFEVVASDGKGFCAAKNPDDSYPSVNYSSGYGNISDIFRSNSVKGKDSNTIGFMPEFTDAYTAVKSFASYNCIYVIDESENVIPYTLMIVSASSDFIDMINLKSGYEMLSTVIINDGGYYIIGNSSFKSDNLYEYISSFNNLSLDQENEIKAYVTSTGKGYISYQDARARDSVFVYTPVANKDWQCVSSVPLSNFHNTETDTAFPFAIAGMMLVLLVIDLVYFSHFNRKLKKSIINERLANAAKSEFLSRMSHDMRTPMNGIMGMTRLTQDISGLPEEVKSNLSAIASSSQYLLQIINDVLDMSKIESDKIVLNRKAIDIKELADNMIYTVKPVAEQKGVDIRVSINGDGNPIVFADPLRLQQICMNLLSNSIKFTPKNGMVIFKMDLSGTSSHTDVSICVEDTGCGMSEEFLNHIFEPFSQENTRIVRGQEGTGLGMAIVKSLVDMMDGTVEIKSQLGSGTKTTVQIRFEVAPPEQLESVGASGKDYSCLNGKRVLLAEDHPLNAKIAIKTLAKVGIESELAVNGKSAVKMFGDSENEYYDAVLMDIRMPEMNGLDAAKAIRALPRKDAGIIPIIAMTANAYAEDIKASMDAGMNAHIAKPIEPTVLYETIIKQLSQSSKADIV